ncbi:hypothetical protein AOQ84DRAFT_67443, partial [Glonium stellatum]
ASPSLRTASSPHQTLSSVADSHALRALTNTTRPTMPQHAFLTPTNLPTSSPEDVAAVVVPHLSLHGHGLADSTTAACLPPALTPATTHRHSVSLGALSNLWSSTELHPTTTSSLTHSSTLPSFTTTSTSASTNPPPTATSTTTTTTNSLHHSAALRALHAGPNRPRTRPATKAPSTNTSLSSQPVVVRTYSGSRSRPASSLHSPRLGPGSHSNSNNHSHSNSHSNSMNGAPNPRPSAAAAAA